MTAARENITSSNQADAAEQPVAAVELDGVTKRFGDVVAVSDLDLSIPAGSFVTVLGPSGCGKTTILRLVAGLEVPTAGRIRIFGRDVLGVSAHQRPTSMVFQDYALFPHLSVRDNVAFGLKMHGVARQERRDRSDRLLETVGLAGFGDRKPRELSGGQRQRVAMARSLILEPNVLLLDEPLGALDARVRRRLREELRAMQRRLGLTFLCVTHDQEDALVVSDYVVVMNAGRVEQWGTPARIYHDPVSSFVADFLGDCNLLRGEVVSLDGIGRGVRVDGLDGTVVRAPRGLKLSAPGTAVMIALRPEAFRLCAPTTGRVDATVLDRIFVGIATQLLLRVGGHRLKAVIPGGGSATSGEVIGLDFDDSSVSVLVSTTEPNPDPSPEANPESDTASVLGSAPDGNAS